MQVRETEEERCVRIATYGIRAPVLDVGVVGVSNVLQVLGCLSEARFYDWGRLSLLWPLALKSLSAPGDNNLLRQFSHQLWICLTSCAKSTIRTSVLTATQEKAVLKQRFSILKHIAQLFGTTTQGQAWLLKLVTNDWVALLDIQRECISLLSKLLGPDKRLFFVLRKLARNPIGLEEARMDAVKVLGELWPIDERVIDLLWCVMADPKVHWYVRAEAMRTLGRIVENDNKLDEFLRELVLNKYECSSTRGEAVLVLAKLTKRSAIFPTMECFGVTQKRSGSTIADSERNREIRPFIESLMLRLDMPWPVRCCAIESRTHLSCDWAWLQKTLMSILGDRDGDVHVRAKALEVLAQHWQGEEWLHHAAAELLRRGLGGGADEGEEPLGLCRQAVSVLTRLGRIDPFIHQILSRPSHGDVFSSFMKRYLLESLTEEIGKQEWFLDLLETIVISEDDKTLRYEAIETLRVLGARRAWAKVVLPSMLTKDVDGTIRRESILILGEVFGRQDWLRSLLVPIANDRMSGDGARYAAVGQLSMSWPEDESDWEKIRNEITYG